MGSLDVRPDEDGLSPVTFGRYMCMLDLWVAYEAGDTLFFAGSAVFLGREGKHCASSGYVGVEDLHRGHS